MRTSIAATLATLCTLSIASSQIISIKTVPLATGNQFSIFPSANMASGGISVAADDGLLDPFTNPAKGYYREGMSIFTAPQMYSISIKRGTREGSGFSVPLGVLTRKGDFFGGLYWARQQLSSEPNAIFGVTPTSTGSIPGTQNDPETNTYTFAMLGTKIPGVDLVVGASVLWGELNSLEGVQLLFPRSPKVLQNGTASDYRLGVMRTLEEDHHLEAVFVRSVFRMRYDVSAAVTTTAGASVLQYTPEYDQTNLWGLQLRYTRPLSEHWRAGTLLTANWKEHPKIPNYDLMSIPRDPGTSTAYNLGVGLFRSQDYAFFGVDLVYEPIETETWAEADKTTEAMYGRTFAPGTKTVENYFSFSNWIGRAGFRTGKESSAFQFGAQFHAIRYDLEQISNLQRSKRDQRESWMEWTLSGGYGFSVGPVHLLYTALLTTGTGQPTVSTTSWTGPARWGGGFGTAMDADFLPAPSGSLSVRKAWVWTHLVSAVYEIE